MTVAKLYSPSKQPYAGRGVIRGFNGLTNGLASPERLPEGLNRARLRGFGDRDAE